MSVAGLENVGDNGKGGEFHNSIFLDPSVTVYIVAVHKKIP